MAPPTLTPRLRLKNLAGPALVAAVLAAGTAYVAAVDPGEPGHYPVCPFLGLTGLLCPGCGGLRCAHALAHGDLGAALGLNALAVLLTPLLAFLWARWAVRSARGEPRTTLARPVLLWALMGVIAVFWVVRNLPFAGALAP